MLLPPIHDWPLPWVGQLQLREPADIDTVVLHCTELPDLAAARRWGERIHHPSGTGNSGHYYIDRDGSIHRFVPPERVAHHVRGWNDATIGIELVNTGRWPAWFDSRNQQMTEAYPEAQIEALLGLLAWLRREFPGLTRIAGHEDLDRERVPASDDPAHTVWRKRDPGPAFPWQRVLHACTLERWHGPEGRPHPVAGTLPP